VTVRWEAAVAAQYRVAAFVDEATDRTDLSPWLVVAINDAATELGNTWDAERRAGVAPSASEYVRAIEPCRRALIAWTQRRRPVALAQQVERLRADGEAALTQWIRD
jgi:hypothetical protein